MRKQSLADIVQFYHLAKRRQAVILRIKGHESRMSAVADVNTLNRRRAIGNALPDAGTRQLLAGPRRQRNRAGIKPRMQRRIRLRRLDQMYRQRAVG